MKLTEETLRQTIKEVLTEHAESNNEVWSAYKEAISVIRDISKRLSDDDSYFFLAELKEWFNKNVLEEQ